MSIRGVGCIRHKGTLSTFTEDQPLVVFFDQQPSQQKIDDLLLWYLEIISAGMLQPWDIPASLEVMNPFCLRS